MSRSKSKNRPTPATESPPDDYWQEKKKLEKNGKKLFVQKVFADWCKDCGICIAFCPADVFEKNTSGAPVIINPDACTGCRFCEYHCPDFAISIHERYPDRRKKKNGT